MTQADELTDQDCTVIFGTCSGLSMGEIAKYLEVSEDVVRNTAIGVYEGLGVSTRLELFQFVRAALNAELQRRRLSPGDSGAAMEG